MSRLIFFHALDQVAKRRLWVARVLRAIEAACVAVLIGGLRFLSPGRASRLGRRVLVRVGRGSRKRSDQIVENLATVFPERSQAELRGLAERTWGNLGAVLGEYPHLADIAQNRRGALLEVVNEGRLEPYITGRRRAVFVGAHLANWEILALVAAREGVSLMVFYKPLRNSHLERLMVRARRRLGCETVSREDFIRPVVRHLRAGGSLGVLADIRVKGGVEVPFFGRDMPTTLTPARLALRYDCDVVTCRAERIGDAQFRVYVEPPLRPGDFEGGGELEDRIWALTLAIHKRLEGQIRKQPGEWLCTNRRWSKVPAAEASSQEHRDSGLAPASGPS